jgi:hypothetical protein
VSWWVVESSWIEGLGEISSYVPSIVLADEAEVSLSGKTKKADMVEAISAHLEKNATGKKSKK